jgi:putative hydrolase of the HAD superfamily
VTRAVTFDAAGTLIVPAEPVGTTYARIAAALGIAVEPEVVDARFRAALAAAPPLAFQDDVAARERAWWRRVVSEALGESAAHARFDDCFGRLYAHYADGGAWRVPPDVAPALARLRAAGLRLGVVSNFDGRLPGLLADVRLADAFDTVVWSSAAGAAKPDPAIFRAAADALGVGLAALLHVGDDGLADVRGARDAGASAMLLDRRGVAPDGVIDLVAAAERILAGDP